MNCPPADAQQSGADQSGSAAKPDGDTASMTVEVDGVEARVSIVKPVVALGLCHAGKEPVGDFGSLEPTRASERVATTLTDN